MSACGAMSCSEASMILYNCRVQFCTLNFNFIQAKIIKLDTCGLHDRCNNNNIIVCECENDASIIGHTEIGIPDEI